MKIINIDESSSFPSNKLINEEKIKKHKPKLGEVSFQNYYDTDVYQWHYRQKSPIWQAIGPKFYIKE